MHMTKEPAPCSPCEFEFQGGSHIMYLLSPWSPLKQLTWNSLTTLVPSSHLLPKIFKEKLSLALENHSQTHINFFFSSILQGQEQARKHSSFILASRTQVSNKIKNYLFSFFWSLSTENVSKETLFLNFLLTSSCLLLVYGQDLQAKALANLYSPQPLCSSRLSHLNIN